VGVEQVGAHEQLGKLLDLMVRHKHLQMMQVRHAQVRGGMGGMPRVVVMVVVVTRRRRRRMVMVVVMTRMMNRRGVVVHD
jgi:hypothetical protein